MWLSNKRPLWSVEVVCGWETKQSSTPVLSGPRSPGDNWTSVNLTNLLIRLWSQDEVMNMGHKAYVRQLPSHHQGVQMPCAPQEDTRGPCALEPGHRTVAQAPGSSSHIQGGISRRNGSTCSQRHARSSVYPTADLLSSQHHRAGLGSHIRKHGF